MKIIKILLLEIEFILTEKWKYFKEEDCEVNGFGAGINIRKSDHIESHINPSKVKNKTLVINNLVYSNGGMELIYTTLRM